MTDEEVFLTIQTIVQRECRAYIEEACAESLAAQCMLVGFGQELLASGQGELVWPALERAEQIAEGMTSADPMLARLGERVVDTLVRLRGGIDNANPDRPRMGLDA